MGTSLELCDCCEKSYLRVNPEVLKVPQGAILVARVGILDLGDGIGPWIPTQEELEYTRDLMHEYIKQPVVVTALVDDDPKVLVTHLGVELTIQDSSDTVSG